MPRGAAAHLLVGRELPAAARIADRRRVDAGEVPELSLSAPETSHAKHGLLEAGWRRFVDRGFQDCVCHVFSFGSNFNATPFMQYRSPVGRGPSGNRWPRW